MPFLLLFLFMAQFFESHRYKSFVMANNFVETIQKDLGFPALQKIDPNIQETKEKVAAHSEQKLAQAAIPAVLTALYKLTRTDDGCKLILGKEDHSDWLGIVFEGKEATAVDKVAHYAGVTKELAESAMENIADEAVVDLQKSAGSSTNCEGVRTFMNDQRHNILVYLPAAMQMGDLLNDEALDDRTNKMEGPVSSFMHKIENKLSKGDQSKYP
jgi:hypothetical protein